LAPCVYDGKRKHTDGASQHVEVPVLAKGIAQNAVRAARKLTTFFDGSADRGRDSACGRCNNFLRFPITVLDRSGNLIYETIRFQPIASGRVTSHSLDLAKQIAPSAFNPVFVHSHSPCLREATFLFGSSTSKRLYRCGTSARGWRSGIRRNGLRPALRSSRHQGDA
jgi:hypothetical protein